MAVLISRSIPCTVVAYNHHQHSTTEWNQEQRAYIDNAAESTDGVRAIENITTDGGVLHDNARRHYNIFGGAGQLLQDEIDHLAQGGVLVLEQLRDAEEERGRLICRELLPGEDEDGNLCKEGATCSRRDGGGIEQSGCRINEHGQLVSGGGDAECGQRTVLEHRGAIQLDHDLVGILVLLDVTHGADRRIARQVVVCRRGTGAVERY
jgi:hypothetical protein